MISSVKMQTAQVLNELNRQFYQTFALQFSETRQRIQAGVRQVLGELPGEANLLDIGCGNGEILRELAARKHRGGYTGLDFSAGLIEEAGKTCRELDYAGAVRFRQADLTQANWQEAAGGDRYDFVLAFAVLHHIPGAEIRQSIFRSTRQLLKADGALIFSTWQPLNSPRLCERVQPWEKIGLSNADVDAGDILMDWKHGGYGLRYVHVFSEEELAELAEATGFAIQKSFYSDGAGGRLGLYQIWKPRS